MRGVVKKEQEFVQLQLQKIDCDASMSSVFTNESLPEPDYNFLSKHFKKRAAAPKPVIQIQPQPKSQERIRKIENVFEYQRNLAIQLQMINNKLDANALRQIDEGCIDDLSQEKLESFVRIYPKESENKKLESKLAEVGIKSFQQGLQALADKTLICDDTTAFMLNLLALGSGLLEKAKIMIRFREVQPKMVNLMTRVKCWKQVTEEITQNRLFSDIIELILRAYKFLSSDQSVKGF